MKWQTRITIFLAFPVLIVTFQNCSSGFDAAGGNSILSQAGPIPAPLPSVSPSSTPTPSPSSTPQNGCATSSGAAEYFACNMYFNQDVSGAQLAANSATLISALQAAGGWGNGGVFQIDFSIDVYYADSSAVSTTVDESVGTWASPDSDDIATISLPPAGGNQGFESSSGKTCDGGDCHYLVMDVPNQQLVEVWHSNVSGGTFNSQGMGGSIAVWPFQKTWLPNFRGDICTSADAGGLMVAPMLFTAEEINAGAIKHAIRLILPNARIANETLVRPATHYTGGSGWAAQATGIPYGSRLRLKANYDTSGFSAGGKVVAQALKTYGMILADGGNIALTAKSDASSTAKYSGLLESTDLAALKVTDFDIIDSGTVYSFTQGSSHNLSGSPTDVYNCTRNP